MTRTCLPPRGADDKGEVPTLPAPQSLR